ncbi:hypothetical protein H9L19_03530 [Weissella diestrammenae]|uniref:Uncharacterized protein n=1 Tax=Weissella diestrammenae TaxID=1162633 RepID=A0A7G9T763_9LACO|nr:DUF6508 domain-containing protein [Weissella diestrammenae]MCM0582460.1 hypothetical protein [Weissella diestrammenae]QNN75938.1 hypothetical protein H9L19_03530 [Weissella diestrammenae]
MTTTHPFNFDSWSTYLQQQESKPIQWGKGHDHLEHPLYDAKIFDLIKAFEQSDYFDQNFARTLMQKGFSEQISEADIREIINETTDFFTLRAITSLIIYNERHIEGLWAAMIENGLLNRLLVKLNTQTPDGYPIW